ncbi:hypothetical protein GCM10028803_21920 [Larkinella knui]|uniref:LysM peptidoglycan-binding domain-containing protein n=1 Tax=Larkinella knui TaxID=2025310 RepID=A0A3P1CVI4_9BACT|nr:LysM peptidoglycan-binding domain-containing protein [Larkinella knui]RRB17268.1 LysM peptidoglycan-binding domain-containing protein [Larkinella knui]
MLENFLGKVEKMKIQAYSDPEFTRREGEPLTVQLNPDGYTRQLQIQYCDTQPAGSVGSDLGFVKVSPPEMWFEFLFDSTGVLQDGSLLPTALDPFSSPKDVVAKVEEFISGIVYDGTIHRSKYLELLWGTLHFTCVLTALDLEYKLFRPDGKPIRVLAKATFKEFKSRRLRTAEANRQSPDITHRKDLKSNDRLSLLAQEVYTTDRYYIDVARANDLTGFRRIRAGTALYFPPLK